MFLREEKSFLEESQETVTKHQESSDCCC